MKNMKLLVVCCSVLFAIAQSGIARAVVLTAPLIPTQEIDTPTTHIPVIRIAGNNELLQTWESLTHNQRVALQAQLNAMGHKVGTPDGIMGSGTRNGILSYQRAGAGAQTGVLAPAQIRDLMRRDDYARTILALDGPAVRAAAPTTRLTAPDNCEELQSDLNAMSKNIGMSIDSPETQVGRALNMTITQPGRVNRPVFAVLAFDRDVRFTGEHLYALLPNTRAPFDLKWKTAQTRLIVPLHVKGTTPAITFGIIPMGLEELVVTASLLAPTACGEMVTELYQHVFRPGVGAPEITVLDEYSTTSPKARLMSPRGDRILELFVGFFRIRTAKNGALIEEYDGFDARFSPDGRFITAGVQGSLSLFDAIDGALLTQSPYAHDVAWDVGGSFLIVGGSGAGVITTHAALFQGPPLAETRTACRVCPATAHSTFRLDLENHVALSTGPLGEAATPLNGFKKYDTAWSGNSGSDISTYGSIANFVNDYAGAAPVVIPENWVLQAGLAFTHIGLETTEFGGDALKDNPLAKFLVQPLALATQAGVQGLGGYTADQSTVRGNPALKAVAPTPASRANFADRMRDAFDVELGKGTSFIEMSPLGEKLGNRVHRLSIDPWIVLDENEVCNLGEVSKKPNGVLVYSAQNTKIWQATTSAGEAISLIGGGCRGGSAGYSASIGGTHRASEQAEITPVLNGPTIVSVLNPGGGCGDCEVSFSLFGDRFAHSWSADTGEISVVDTVTGAGKLFRAAQGDLIVEYFQVVDTPYSVQLNSNGRFYVYDVSKLLANSEEGGDNNSRDNPPILSGLYANDELVVWNGQGYFDATFEGAQNVFLKFPAVEQPFVIDQYNALLRRPGLVKSALLTGVQLPAPNLAVPPMIRTRVTASASDGTALHITHEGGSQPRNVQVFQDGLLTQTVSWNQTASSIVVPIARLPGVRWVSTVVQDADDLLSAPQSFDWGPAKAQRKLRVLAIGVDAYNDPRLETLTAAKTDAFKFLGALDSKRSAIYDVIDVLPPLGDEGATKEEILKSLDLLVADSGPETDIMLFFAGHGLRSVENELYLGLTQTNPLDLGETALPWASVAEKIANAPGRVLVFLDACHSGDAGRSFFGTNDAAAAALLSNLTGSATIFAASKGRQSSLETQQTSGGVFTHAVTQILTEDRSVTDSDKNGSIELSEFYRSLRERVEVFSDGQQTPWFTRNRMIGETGFF